MEGANNANIYYQNIAPVALAKLNVFSARQVFARKFMRGGMHFRIYFE